MNAFVDQVRALARAGDIRISEHGYDELAEDGLTAREVLGGVAEAVVVEEYPNHPKGRCGLFLQKDRDGAPIHLGVSGTDHGFAVGRSASNAKPLSVPPCSLLLSRPPFLDGLILAPATDKQGY